MIVLPLCISQVDDILVRPDVPLAAWVIGHIGKCGCKYLIRIITKIKPIACCFCR